MSDQESRPILTPLDYSQNVVWLAVNGTTRFFGFKGGMTVIGVIVVLSGGTWAFTPTAMLPLTSNPLLFVSIVSVVFLLGLLRGGYQQHVIDCKLTSQAAKPIELHEVKTQIAKVCKWLRSSPQIENPNQFKDRIEELFTIAFNTECPVYEGDTMESIATNLECLTKYLQRGDGPGQCCLDCKLPAWVLDLK